MNLVAATLGSHHSRNDHWTETFVAHPIDARYGCHWDDSQETYVAHTLTAPDPNAAKRDGKRQDGSRTDKIPIVAFAERSREAGRTLEIQEELAYALANPGSGGQTHSRQLAGPFGVRRLTPTECERLQGFPDGHTAGQSDSARYRQLGNAVCVLVAQWIGRRILEADATLPPLEKGE